MTWWEEVGTVAAVVAAVAGILSWRVGVRASRSSTDALHFERLAEARRLVGEIRLMGDNTYWDRCSEAQAQLRSARAASSDAADNISPTQTRRLAGAIWYRFWYRSHLMSRAPTSRNVTLQAACDVT